MISISVNLKKNLPQISLIDADLKIKICENPRNLREKYFQAGLKFLHVKPEMHDVAVLHNVILSFDVNLTHFAAGCF